MPKEIAEEPQVAADLLDLLKKSVHLEKFINLLNSMMINYLNELLCRGAHPIIIVPAREKLKNTFVINYSRF